MLHQQIQYLIRMRSSVIYIAQYMKMIHSQSLNQVSQRNKELITIVKTENCFHNLSVVNTSVIILILLRMYKLINNICKIHWHCLSHLGSCVFRRQQLCNLNQLTKYISVPFISHLIFLHKNRKLLPWIIYKCTQLLLFKYSKLISIQHSYLLFN